jgi:hypothetical protein
VINYGTFSEEATMPRRNFKKEFLVVLERELDACGLPSQREAQDFLQALIKGRIPRGAKNLGLRTLALTVATALRQQMTQNLKTEADLARALRAIQGLRYRIRPGLAEASGNLQRLLLQKKRGPKAALTDVQKQMACNTIEAFRKNGNTTKHAIELVARDHGVTPRLMREIWQRKGV